MGDILEITTHGSQPISFYKISSSAISFQVKGSNTALIGLAKKPGKVCQYWCGILPDGQVWIKGTQGRKTSPNVANGLSLHSYNRYWISWYSGFLRIGQDVEASPLLSYPNDLELNYVTFTTYDATLPCTWKLNMPPLALNKIRENNICKKIEGEELRWVAAEGQLPDDAVIGGFESECLYIVRAKHRGSLTPGKFVPSEGLAYIPWGGNSNIPPEFEVLCGLNFSWMLTSDDEIPTNAFVAGYSEYNEEKLYIGRVNHMNCLVPGKVQPSHRVCYVAFGTREINFKNYEILIIPDLHPHADKYGVLVDDYDLPVDEDNLQIDEIYLQLN